MAVTAGLLMCRQTTSGPEFFLVHPGGPYWKNKDAGAWSIPKGMVEAGEDVLHTAQREFREETGIQPTGPFMPLGSLKTRGGKTLYAWVFLGNWKDEDGIVSNQVEIEFPYRSNRYISIPEVDRAAWWSEAEAKIHINPSQLPMIERAMVLLSGGRQGG